jgi:tryptophan synthase alpha subunit
MIGFGISDSKSIKTFSPYCDGLIVGSAVIKKLSDDDSAFSQTMQLVKELSNACVVTN